MTDALPQHCPTPRELDDLELIAHGAVQPAGFTDDPQGVTLTLPTELAADGTTVELVDPEGLPLAQVSIERTYDPNAKTSVVPLPMLDSHDNEALRDLLDSVAADVVHYDCAVRVQVRQAKDYPWVASLLSARVKRLQPGYALRLVQDLKPDETPRLVLSPRNP